MKLRGKIAVVSLLKEVKNTVQTFFIPTPDRIRRDPFGMILIFPSISPTSENPPISPVPKKSKLKAQHGVNVQAEVRGDTAGDLNASVMFPTRRSK